MKKATLVSTAVWAGAAIVIIGRQFASQLWPMASTNLANQVFTWIILGITTASIGLMKNATASELLPSSHNSKSRNALKIANIIGSLMAGASLLYLSGLFSNVNFPSSSFALAIGILLLGIAVQAIFAVVT